MTAEGKEKTVEGRQAESKATNQVLTVEIHLGSQLSSVLWPTTLDADGGGAVSS